MAYLPRNERRIEVLEAVIRIAATDGFSAATVRRIGAELDMSAGNIHHLFGSAATLRREAFEHFAELELAGIDAESDLAPPLEQLFAYLYSVSTGPDRSSHHIWQSAGVEASKDADFMAAWQRESGRWVERFRDLLLEIVDTDITHAAADASAWRLMCSAVGMSVFFGNADHAVSEETCIRSLDLMIANELRDLSNRSINPPRPVHPQHLPGRSSIAIQ